MMTAPELKPCPFCGADMLAEGARYEHPISEASPLHSMYIDSRHLALWNTRDAPPEVEALVDALLEASAYLHGGHPLNVAGGHRNDYLREKLGAALAKWEWR